MFSKKTLGSIGAIILAVLTYFLQGGEPMPSTTNTTPPPNTIETRTRTNDKQDKLTDIAPPSLPKLNTRDLITKDKEQTKTKTRQNEKVKINPPNQKIEDNKDTKKSTRRVVPSESERNISERDISPAMARDRKLLTSLSSNRIDYTRHARCRMKCRYISEREIQEILRKGTINHRKSEPNDTPCPSYAVEGFTDDKQEVRIVFAKCNTSTKVITAIDLGNKYNCHCD